MIDITMTAIVLRPEILEETLISLTQNLKTSKTLRLIIDIAPAANSPHSQADLWEVARFYFGKNLICRMVNPSLQAEAIKWMWDRSDTPFVLHWEDDWVLTRELNLDAVIGLFNLFSEINMSMVFFDRYEKSVLDYSGYKGKFTKSTMHNSFYHRNVNTGLGGPPALLRKDYKEQVLCLMKDTECLDITSKTNKAKRLLKKWNVGVYTGKNGKGNLVKDIGKEWRAARGLKMVKDTKRGVTWMKK